ncbi:Regulatory protein RecX [bioreactor metagenome]|uniref:Regulatory protein RecX n=1 Tax=bioreactor metagenome TaxID=1076179 RepID=A0A645DJQ0_9ZZZZ
MDTTVYIRAQDTAARYLGYKMRTKREVAEKLSESGYSENIAERVLQSLEKYDYINDDIYCIKYIKETLELRPKGKFLIKQALKLKGIDEETIDRAIEEAEIDELEIAKSLLMKKYEGFANMDNKELSKTYGFLQRKGFSYGIIKEAVRELADNGI